MVALTKLYALITVRRQRWLTREVAVVDGQLRRTGSAAGSDHMPQQVGAMAFTTVTPDTIDLRDGERVLAQGDFR